MNVYEKNNLMGFGVDIFHVTHSLRVICLGG